MENILTAAESADSLILASPMNFYTITALMKRFIERLIVYAYWPWKSWSPKQRPRTMNKKAVLIVSSACPAFIGKLFFSNTFKILKSAADLLGAKVVKKLYFGAIAVEENQTLPLKYKTKLHKSAQELIE